MAGGQPLEGQGERPPRRPANAPDHRHHPRRWAARGPAASGPARALDQTAHALACDVVTADGRHSQVELRMLEEVREELKIDRLHAAAIEWGARVRHMGV